MKRSFFPVAFGLLALVLVLAGCQQATSGSSSAAKPADISTASAATQAKYAKAFSALGSINSTPPAPSMLTLTDSSSGSTINLTATFTNYSIDGGANVINGTATMTGTSNSTSANLVETGSFDISGTAGNSGHIVLSLTVNLTTTGTGPSAVSHGIIAGTVTVDGVTYSMSQTI